MKKNQNKLRAWMNALITTVLGVLGVTSCIAPPMYGPAVMYGPAMPDCSLSLDGEVTDEQNEPLKSMQVIIKTPRLGTIDSLYTNAGGKFNTAYALPESENDTLQILVNDTSNVYASDTVQVPFSDMELESESEWTKYYDLDIDIHLKKK